MLDINSQTTPQKAHTINGMLMINELADHVSNVIKLTHMPSSLVNDLHKIETRLRLEANRDGN